MTEEQIKQNAEAYADSMGDLWELEWCATRDDFIAGAHSRDEEIKEIKEIYHDMFCTLANKVEELRNPWISVEDRLPERQSNQDVPPHRIRSSKDVLCATNGKFHGRAYYSYARMQWEWNKSSIGYVTHWMPIPELKKGE